jgi:hypothetical protein
MENLEIHTLICKKDITYFIDTLKLFKHYTGLNFLTVIHEDGSFSDDDCVFLEKTISPIKIWRRKDADSAVAPLLVNYPNCFHFRFAAHHTIFKIKLFDPFLLSQSGNVIIMDADILFCKKPEALIDCINKGIGFYFKDTWSSYCVPFRDEDGDKTILRSINAGMTYFPSKGYYSLDAIEECLKTLYSHGSKGATHPFLEQTCIAYLITKQKERRLNFIQLPHPDYCIPTFNEFRPEHGLVALHLNSSPLVGKFKLEHYQHELTKI